MRSSMFKLSVPVVLGGGVLFITAGALANDDGDGRKPLTVAVYGDAPYGTSPTDTTQTAATPAFIDTINADPDVSARDARGRHSFGQPVLHRGLRSAGLRSLEGLQGSADLHAGGQRVGGLQQEEGGRRCLQRGHRRHRLRPRRRRQPGELRERQPGREPRPHPLDLLLASPATRSAESRRWCCRRRSSIDRAPPLGRKVRRERDVGTERRPVRDDQPAGRVEQRPRRLVRRARRDGRSRRRSARSARAPTCAGWTPPSRSPGSVGSRAWSSWPRPTCGIPRRALLTRPATSRSSPASPRRPQPSAAPC